MLRLYVPKAGFTLSRCLIPAADLGLVNPDIIWVPKVSSVKLPSDAPVDVHIWQIHLIVGLKTRLLKETWAKRGTKCEFTAEIVSDFLRQNENSSF